MQEKEKRIADVMRSVPAWCTVSQSVQTVAEVMRDYGVHRVSVIDPETNLLLGTISERELCLLVVAAGLDPRATTAGEIMHREPAVCVAEMDLISARYLMVRQRAHQLPVVDENKRLIGTVFLADLLGGNEAKLAKR
ncbi:MAG: CBS domain-containing protein [Terriglobales bacterium]